MARSFPRVNEIAAGAVITSTQQAALANAFNARLREVGDLAWRISWYWFSLWRQVRNPDETGSVFPPQGEWHSVYGNIDPDYTTVEWPAVTPGDPEGANLANPAMAFVYGYAGGPDDEPFRMTIPMSNPSTPSGKWQLGKDQRGAYDPVTTAQNAPAFDAAVQMFGFGFGETSIYHKSYGGRIAQPAPILDNCGTLSSSGLGIPSYEIKFTALRADAPTAGLHGTIGSSGGMPTVTYAGTCPCGTEEHTSGHVLSVITTPLEYKVLVSQGDVSCTPDVDRLPARDWIPGPYEASPRMIHTQGDQLYRASWQFLVDYRGSVDQRASDNYRVREVAPDHQRFFTSQYALAPAKGHVDGPDVVADYPTARIEGAASQPAGTEAVWTDSSTTTRATDDNFVVGGMLVTAGGLVGSAQVALYDDTVLIGTVTITADGLGAAEEMAWFPNALGATALRAELLTPAAFTDGTGWIEVEIAEIVAWKPFYWDAVLCMRNGGTQGGDIYSPGVDGRGLEFEGGPDLTNNLFRYGCLINTEGLSPRPQADWVNDNPLYDAARRISRSHSRIVPRQQLVAYEVVDGKSVCYFKRFSNGFSSDHYDMFDGIAPPWDRVALGTIQDGETYVVEGTTGTVEYMGTAHTPGSQFTGSTSTDFVSTGDCELYIVDGIRATAPKRGWTNEWVALVETKCYHTSSTSIWKTEAYTDYFTFNNRCLFYAGVNDLAEFSKLREMVAINYGVSVDGGTGAPSLGPLYISDILIAPEAPSSLNYNVGTDNTTSAADDDFCSSCRMYEQPYEIESCTVDTRGGDEVIKVVFKTRFREHPDAPASVNKNVGSWSGGEKSALAAETYRTDDNALREYVLNQHDGTTCTFKTGDAGAGSSVPFLPDNPFGSCYPTFHFVKLVPKPYEDGNDTHQSTDTRRMVDNFLQMETYLRVICEAFVDGQTSADLVCTLDEANLYDFTYENLCFQAFEGRWIGAFNLTDRPDDSPGFGPLPNVKMYREVYNRLASAVNLLTKMRVDLPVVVSTRTIDGTASEALDDGGFSCSDTGAVIAWFDGITPPLSDAATAGSWGTGTSFVAQQTAGVIGCPFEIETRRQDAEWKIEIDSQFTLALPAHIADMFDSGQIGLMSKRVHRTSYVTRTVASGLADGDPCCRVADEPCPGHWVQAGTYYKWVATETNETSCAVISQGLYSAAVPPSGDFNLGRDSAMNPGVFCATGSFTEDTYTLYEDTPYIEWDLV